MDEDAAWYGSRPRPRPHCTRRGPRSRERGTAAPSFRPMSCGHGRPSQLLLSSCNIVDDTETMLITVPPQIFQQVHLDHVKRATHALSLCCEIIPVKCTSAAETCRVLVCDWIVKYGVFSELASDRHASFTGKLTKLLTRNHSRSNGQVKKVNGLILRGLRTCCQGLTEWPKLLAPIAAAYKAAVVPSRGASPFKLMYGVAMRLPFENEFTYNLPAHKRSTNDAELLSKQHHPHNPQT